jgi:hypothetical protein
MKKLLLLPLGWYLYVRQITGAILLGIAKH